MNQIPYNKLQIVTLTKKHDLTSFNSTNSDLNDFLNNCALNDQNERVSRTYLCMWERSITGYVALVTDTLEVHAVDEKDGIKNYLYHKYPAVRIARLAVDRNFMNRGVGRFLLLVAIGMAIEVSNKIGCRYITVDSKPESIGFYEKHNFKLVEKYRNNDFPKMYLNMYPIIAMMQPKESKEKSER
ncbi:MAG: GNAT family N-acetyltransferase [Candidatus Methanoperedens sp.]|nr:GNAT family N-acetyltransferase [Candidatus Methanoperedens sp.]